MLIKVVSLVLPLLTQEATCMSSQVRAWVSIQASEVEAYARTPHLTKRRGARSLWLEKRIELKLIGPVGACAARAALHSLSVRYVGDAASERAIIRLQLFLEWGREVGR